MSLDVLELLVGVLSSPEVTSIDDGEVWDRELSDAGTGVRDLVKGLEDLLLLVVGTDVLDLDMELDDLLLSVVGTEVRDLDLPLLLGEDDVLALGEDMLLSLGDGMDVSGLSASSSTESLSARSISSSSSGKFTNL